MDMPGLSVANGRVEDHVPNFANHTISRALLDLLPAAVYVCATDGTILRFNRRAAELWGREPLLADPRDRFCGSHRMYRPNGGPLPHDECPMADILRDGVPVLDREVVIERPDGSRCTALVNIRPLKDPAGNITGAVNCFHDITGRKQAEQDYVLTRNQVEDLTLTLAQERDQSRALIDAQPAAIYTTDAAGMLTFYNEAAVGLWGYRPEIGKAAFCGAWKLYHSDGTPMPHREGPVALTLQQKRPIKGMEAVAERPDGTRVPFISYPTPLLDASGAVVGAVNMLVDISERRRAENQQAALHKFTDRLYRADSRQAVYDAALDAIGEALGCERGSILLFDESGAMRFVAWRGLSDAYRRAVDGHSPWTRNTTNPQPICIADVDTADLAPLKATVQAEGIGALAFIPLMAKGVLVGKFMTYYAAGHVFSDSEIDLAVTIARQLGFAVERMDAEDARIRAELELSDFFENASVAFHWVGADGTILKANRRELEMLGLRADEYIGRNIAEFHVSPEVIADILKRLTNGEILTNSEAQLRCKDGSIRDVLITSSVLWDDTRFVHTRCLTTDITDRKQAQARQDLLAREIQHRTKNLFSVIQAIVARSFADKRTVSEAKTTVMERLHALAQTHAMLVDKDWQGAGLTEVVRTEMSPFADRVTIEGPVVMLTAQAAQNFALAVHELVTNAAKYGALSNATGHVLISWSVGKLDGHPQFIFRWCERGGPQVTTPTHKGFGSAVLEQVMAEYFETPPQIEFAAGGITYEVRGSLEDISAPAAAE